MSCENPNRFIQICVDGAPVGTGNPLPTSGGGGPGSNVLVTDIEDGAGDSVMDAANNAVRVNIVAGAGSGGTAMTDESAFTEGATSFTPVGGVFNDALATPPAAGQAAAARITAQRGIHSNLRNATGTEIGTAAAPVRTDPTGTTAQPITDNAGSITVDAPAATPVAVAITNTANVLVKPGDAVNDAIRVNVVAGGGGGGAVTIADGADVALGATTDAAATTDAGTFSLIALFKRLLGKFTTQFPAALVGGRFDVNVGASLPAGTNNIGDIDVLTLPSIPAGTNNIGDVDVLSLPALPAGTNNIGEVVVSNIEDGAGDSVMDATNNAVRVNVVAGGSSGGVVAVTYTDALNLDIDVGGISQQVFAANANRTGLIIQNNSDEDLWVNFGAAATLAPPSLRLIGGGLGMLQYPDGTGRLPVGTVNINGATTGQDFSAKEAEDV